MYPMSTNYPVPDAGPAGLVPPMVLPHVHLVSSFRYPRLSQLPLEKAVEFLLQAPSIVRDTSAVAWTYFPSPPADGTVLLTWQPPQLGTLFASDGYVWADGPEVGYQRNVRGYQVQVLMQKSGFAYPNETVATHARMRVRIVGGPTQFDSNLWIVYYHQAEPQNRMPASAVSMTPQILAQMNTRASLENQGQLVQKLFMLYDRANWPKVEFAAAARPQPPYYNPMQPGRAYNQPPPSKRPRPSAPQARQAMHPDATLASLDEEESSTQDAFDFITPREISLSRFKQHHEWMEEIFSSPYAMGNILPIDLGLGLMGELAPLTTGLLDAPAGDYRKNSKDKYAVKGYTKLAPEQLKVFEARVEAYTAKEEAELEKMKAAHAKKMAALKRSRTYIKAERRLRELPQRRTADDAADNDGPDPLQAIVEHLEGTLGVRFDTKKDVICVEKGGFQEEQLVPAERSQQTTGNGPTGPEPDNTASGLMDSVEAENSAAGLLDQYGSNSMAGTPGASLSIPGLSQPQSQSQSAVATPSAVPTEPQQQQQTVSDPSTTQGPTGTDHLLDLDIEMSGMASGAEEKSGGDNDWVMVDHNADRGQQNPSMARMSSGNKPQQPPTSGDGSAAADGRAGANTGGTTGTGGPPTAGASVDADASTTMFDTADFGSFDNLDSAGDALADFTNVDDGMGLDLVDDSAFGDAFHGTEMHHGASGNGENQ